MADANRVLGLTVDAGGAIGPTQQLTAALKETGAAADNTSASVTSLAAAETAAGTAAQSVAQQRAQIAEEYRAKQQALIDSHKELSRAQASSNATAQAAERTDEVYVRVKNQLIEAERQRIRGMNEASDAAARERTELETLLAKERELEVENKRLEESTRATAEAADKVNTSATRLVGPLRTLADQALGVNRATGSLATGLLGLGASGTVVLGVVAAGAILGGTYDLLTKKSHEAAKAQAEQTAELAKWYETQRAGAGGALVAQTKAASESLTQLEARLKEVRRLEALPTTTGAGDEGVAGATPAVLGFNAKDLQAQEALLLKQIKAGHDQINKLNLDAANERRAQAGADLADLVRSNNASIQERARYTALITNDQKELAFLNKKAADDPSVDNVAKRRALIEEIKSATDAQEKLNKVEEKTLATEIKRYDAQLQSEAQMLKAASIQDQAAAKARNDNETVTRVAQQQLELSKLGGLAAAQQVVENKAINESFKVKATLFGQQRVDALAAIEDARKLGLQEAQNADQRKKDGVEADALVKSAKEARQAQLSMNKEIGSAAQRADEDVAKLSRSIGGDLLSAILDVTKSGDLSFARLFESVGQYALRASEQAGRAIEKIGTTIDEVKKKFGNAANTDALEESLKRAQSTQTKVNNVAAGALGAVTGYNIGSQTTNRALGTLGGAASGAATGGELGGLPGAIIGGLAGAIGGLLGSSKAANQAAAQMANSQAQLQEALKGITASFANDSLTASIAQAKSQFDDLRKSTEAAYSGKKNEAERNVVLAQLNALEAKRVALLQEEYAAQQVQAQQDYEVRRLAATGDAAASAALAERTAQQREYDAAVKDGANSTTLAALSATLLAEHTKFLADQQKLAADAEQARLDKIKAEQDAEVQRFETVRRVNESLIAQVLSNYGNTRGGEDFTRAANNRQALQDAQPENKDFVAFAGRVADWTVEAQRAIEDGTTAVTKSVEAGIAVNAVLLQAAKDDAAQRTAANNATIDTQQAIITAAKQTATDNIAGIQARAKEESTRLDSLIANAQLQATYAQQSLQTQQATLAETQRVVANLDTFNKSLTLGNLSTLSPAQKLAESQKQFDDLLRAARAGDSLAAGNVSGAAGNLLTQAQGTLGTTTAYGTVFTTVQAALSALQTQYGFKVGTDTDAVTRAQSQVSQAQEQIESSQALKQALSDRTAAEIQAQNDLRDVTVNGAQSIIDQAKADNDTIRDALSAFATATDVANDILKQNGIDSIAALTAIANETKQARIANDAFYPRFLELVANGGLSGVDKVPAVPVATASGQDMMNGTLQKQVDGLLALVDAQNAQIAILQAAAREAREDSIALRNAIEENTRSTKQVVQETLV